MATNTSNLKLIKPARGEFEGTWDIPMNKNSDTIDGAIYDLQVETQNARGTQGSLTARLDVGINADGSLKDIPEIGIARDSTVYGSGTSLDARIESGDRDVFDACQGASSLRSALAGAIDDNIHNSIQSAPVGFLSFTGAVVKVDGSVTPVVCNINGYRNVVRKLKTVTITGAAGTYYVYLERNSIGELYLDRTTVGLNSGATGVNVVLNKFTDLTQNYLTSGVQPGDILEITSTGSVNKGQYIVDSVIDANNLMVRGTFLSAEANLYYKITNPLAPSLSFTATAHAKRWQTETNKIYIGRAVFDGSNVTSVTSYAIKGRYEQFIAVSALPFTQTVSHNLGYVPKNIMFYASQANDYSLDLEPLSVSDMTASTLLRSVIVKMNDLTLSVKNTTTGTFYKGYDGTTYTTGYLLIIAER
jgi:hypothetical protein